MLFSERENLSEQAASALRQMIMGFRATHLIHAAAALGIADLLVDGARTSADLARCTCADQPAMYRLLRALASMGIFTEVSPGRFGLTPLSDLLKSDAPGSLRGLALLYGQDWYLEAYGALLHSVRTGKPAFDHVHGMGLFEYLERDKNAAGIFNHAMSSYTGQEAAAILAAYDLSRFGVVVDVGGGHGALLAELLKAHPRMRGILYDLPGVIGGAREILAPVLDRCGLIAGDFFASIPRGGDAYVLKSIIHDWDDEASRTILYNCRAAMAQRAVLILLERVIPAGSTPSEAKLFDINMLVSTTGRERSEDEYRALLNAAGFALQTIVPTASPLSVIKAVPI